MPEFNAGAMENAGAVTITETYVFRSKVPEAVVERRALTILHELAHMWFGDLVTMRWWDDLWLNESFAEYASTRCQAESTAWRTAWTTFSSSEKSWAYRQDQLASTHPIVADIRDLADVEVNFDGITYAKGASVLKQLVHWVGTATPSTPGCAATSAPTPGATPRWPTCSPNWNAPAGATWTAWARSGCRPPGWPRSAPTLETHRRTADIAALAVVQTAPTDHPTLRSHRLADRLLRPGRRPAAAHPAGRAGRRRRPDRGARAGRRHRRPTCCWSTTTTWPTRRSGSTPAR